MISLQLSCSQFKGRAQKDRPKNTKKYRKPDSREGEGYHNGVLPAGRYHLLEVKQPVYGCTSHLWNRAFCILQAVPAQNVSPAPLPSSVSFSLPESGGKDKKMTNMLMNGAVAIYGGVGVMEIHQPLPQAVESVAQAVEDLAVNAHISLRELKNCVDKVLEKKIPGYKQLMETNPVVAARATVNGATITAYTNGYAVYEADDAHTVLDVNRCGDYRYDFNDGTSAIKSAMAELGPNEVTNRTKIEPLAQQKLAESLNQKYGEGAVFINKVVINNMDFEEAYNTAIQQKSIAQQNADKQKIENEAAIAKAEADKQVAITNAEAEAQKTSIAADAQAEANRKIAESLSDTLIEYQKIQKWDGKLPTVSGSNALVSIDPAE